VPVIRIRKIQHLNKGLIPQHKAVPDCRIHPLPQAAGFLI